MFKLMLKRTSASAWRCFAWLAVKAGHWKSDWFF